MPGLGSDIVQNVGRILQRLLNTLLLLALPLGLALNFCLPSALTLWICHQKPGGVGIGLSVAQVTTWWVLHRQAAFLCKYTRAVCCTTNNKKQEQTLHFNHVRGSRAANSVVFEGGRGQLASGLIPQIFSCAPQLTCSAWHMQLQSWEAKNNWEYFNFFKLMWTL